jgi:hypothetical protein
VIDSYMVIDGREMELRELFLKLRERLAARCGKEVSIDILLRTYSDAKKVSAFAAMSGCLANIEKNENSYVVHIIGNVCCV